MVNQNKVTGKVMVGQFHYTLEDTLDVPKKNTSRNACFWTTVNSDK